MPTEGLSARVRRMSPSRYTVAEAASLVGRSPDTLLRWRKNGTYVPKERMKFGNINVHLYTDADIEAMRKLAKTMKPGRPRKEKA